MTTVDKREDESKKKRLACLSASVEASRVRTRQFAVRTTVTCFTNNASRRDTPRLTLPLMAHILFWYPSAYMYIIILSFEARPPLIHSLLLPIGIRCSLVFDPLASKPSPIGGRINLKWLN